MTDSNESIKENNSGLRDTNKENVVYFGRINFRSRNKLFGIKRSDRRQHMYIIGKTGTGKTALLYNLIIQDIVNGEGVCVVDPHGELVENLLTKIPRERINDVVYFNPSDPDYHIGFNILEISNPKYKHLVASSLMGIFTKIWSNVWSARMEYILNNAILALLDTPGSTLLSISRILVDKDYRQNVIKNIQDPVVKAFWVNEFEEWREQFRNEAIAPIQNKVGQFLSSPIIRNIVGQVKSTIDVFDIMNSGKIFLINVSKGRIGEDNAALLGSMLITKIQLAAMERVRIPEDERVDFFLYVDEFQNFATDSFANILSEARKYRLNIILAHQYIGQLVTDVSQKVKDAVFGNVGTMIVFRVGAYDAEFLEKEFSPEFSVEDLVNLPNYHICLKIMVDGVASHPFSAVTLPPFKFASVDTTAREIINISRKLYMRPRYLVEEEIKNWSLGKEITFSDKKNFHFFDKRKKLKQGSVWKLRELGINGHFTNKADFKSIRNLNSDSNYEKGNLNFESGIDIVGGENLKEKNNEEVYLKDLSNNESKIVASLENKKLNNEEKSYTVEYLKSALKESLKKMESDSNS